MNKKCNKNLFAKFGKESIIYLIGNVASGISGLISVVLYTRIFSPDDYGNYSLVISIINLAIFLLVEWINQSIIRFYDYYNNNHMGKQFYSSIFLGIVIINLIAITLAFLNIYIFRPMFSNLIIKLLNISVIVFISQSIVNVLNFLFRAQRYAKVYSFNIIIISFSKVVIVYLLFNYGNLGVESILLSIILGNLIIIINSLRYINIVRDVKIKFASYDILIEFIKYGLPLIGMMATNWILAVSDRYIIKLYYTSKEVGIYSMCYSLGSNIFNMITMFMMLSAFPIIVKTWNDFGKLKTQNLITKMLRYYFMVSIPAFFGFAVLSKDILGIIGTKDYINGYPILILVALGIIFLGITLYTNKVWELTKNTKVIFSLNVVAAVTNVVLNFMFIPTFGYKIASVTTVVSYLLYLIISLIKSKKVFSINFDIKSMLKVVFASIIMSIVVKLITLIYNNSITGIIISILIGIIIYLFLLVMLKEIDEEFAYIINKLHYSKLKNKS